ncbi:MAG: hypothetical protein ACT4NU_03280 [Chromatiales bacterium]
MKWWPWRTVLRRAALRHGFLDPFAVIARLQRFAQPSEVAEPIELLRAGVAMHARGLINSRVIQNNLDWVWPYWVCRQFDPADPAFVPRAFSLTHINLTHRNWTAVGLPDAVELPVVDPRGLVTPLLDGWSLDGWVLGEDGRRLLPPVVRVAEQRLDLDQGLAVTTEMRLNGLHLCVRTDMMQTLETPVCRILYTGQSCVAGWLVVALRPYNPEGISFIHRIKLDNDRRAWQIDEAARAVEFSAPADRHQVSHYRHGDVCTRVTNSDEETEATCEVGMATAAACFRLEPDVARTIEVYVPLAAASPRRSHTARDWQDALLDHCALDIPDHGVRFLYDAAIRNLVLLSPDEVFPGPYTYRRFWFRDAAYMIHALLYVGLTGRARRALDRFPERQNVLGYFHSQDGEWDSNGQALWILARFCQLTGEPPPPSWHKAINHGARWIVKKRLKAAGSAPHAGLLPPGFSAEHFGPNDYYYWDDFWGVAGLRGASTLAAAYGDAALAREYRREAVEFMRAIETSFERACVRIGRIAMPASPYRRLDAGAVGCLAAGYPLQLFAADDPRLLDTADFLLENCLVDGGFFQDIIHSGINAYLTLHLAQVLLRAGDPRCMDLMRKVAQLASPTGQWPEAIHPRTRGGCMGDGQHGWAIAEWIIMVRNCFVREEGERLVLGAGVPEAWLTSGTRLAFGPTQTPFGPLRVQLRSSEERVTVEWSCHWRTAPEVVEVRVPGFAPLSARPEQRYAEITRENRP